MLLLPAGTLTAGTSDWKACTYTNNWLSVCNNEYTYPGIFMHEIGHNIGLLHSHNEVSYGAGSCLIGSSTSKLDGPHLCFNSAKSWQLGWYENKRLTLYAEDVVDELYNLVTIADYGITPKGK